jgi:hypothetical protein
MLAMSVESMQKQWLAFNQADNSIAKFVPLRREAAFVFRPLH